MKSINGNTVQSLYNTILGSIGMNLVLKGQFNKEIKTVKKNW